MKVKTDLVIRNNFVYNVNLSEKNRFCNYHPLEYS